MPARPPRDITPRTFFEEWLPSVFAAEYSGGRRAASDVTVRVTLEGEGGGVWDLAIAGGRLTVGPGGRGAADVALAWTVADWRAVAVGEPGTVDLAPPQASALDLLFVDSASRHVLATVRGAIRLEVAGYNGRTWSMLVKLGAAPGPDPQATISIDADTWGQILARTLAPPEAYFSGRIRLAGDTGLAMQLAMGMMPRFT